jgi:hypothetical protein
MDEAFDVQAEAVRVLLLVFEAQLRAQVEAFNEFLPTFDAQLREVSSAQANISAQS